MNLSTNQNELLLNISTCVLPSSSSLIFFRAGSSAKHDRFICDIVVIFRRTF